MIVLIPRLIRLGRYRATSTGELPTRAQAELNGRATETLNCSSRWRRRWDFGSLPGTGHTSMVRLPYFVFLLSQGYAHVPCQGETSAGGIPGRVTNIAGFLRSNDTDYYESYQDYYRSATDIIRRYQVTEGGPIILVQVGDYFPRAHLPSTNFTVHERERRAAVLMWDWAGRERIHEQHQFRHAQPSDEEPIHASARGYPQRARYCFASQ